MFGKRERSCTDTSDMESELKKWAALIKLSGVTAQ